MTLTRKKSSAAKSTLNLPSWIDADFRDFVRRVCRQFCNVLAPYDVERSYIIFTSELPKTFRGSGFRGFTSNSEDLLVKQHLPALWQGRGFACILNDELIATTLEKKLESSKPTVDELRELYVDRCLAVTIHELAHEVDSPKKRGDVPTAKKVASFVKGSVKWARKKHGGDGSDSGPLAPLPFASHAWQFHRVLLHLMYRAMKTGNRRAARSVTGFEIYSLSSADEYAAAIGDEPIRLQAEPFSVIRAAPIPAAFAALWRRDFLQWLNAAEMSRAVTKKITAHRAELFIEQAAVERPEAHHDRRFGKSDSAADGPEANESRGLAAACS